MTPTQNQKTILQRPAAAGFLLESSDVFVWTQIRDHFEGWMFPNYHCTCLRREQDALAKLKVFGVLLSCGFVCKRGLSLFEGYV